MVERAFLIAVVLVAGGYTLIAATAIRAPIQYDPLGPESWPLILGGLLVVTALARLLRPVGVRFDLERHAGLRILATVALLVLYAALFQRVGFTFATWGFCSGLTLMLGARPFSALAFGLGAGLLTYLLFTQLLDLRLPAGPFGGAF
jgi:putative tricarboxylic transport membrane protein